MLVNRSYALFFCNILLSCEFIIVTNMHIFPIHEQQDDLFAHLIDKPLYKYHSMERLFLKFCIRIQNLKVH